MFVHFLLFSVHHFREELLFQNTRRFSFVCFQLTCVLCVFLLRAKFSLYFTVLRRESLLTPLVGHFSHCWCLESWSEAVRFLWHWNTCWTCLSSIKCRPELTTVFSFIISCRFKSYKVSSFVTHQHLSMQRTRQW